MSEKFIVEGGLSIPSGKNLELNGVSLGSILDAQTGSSSTALLTENAIVDYVAAQITLEDIDFSTSSGAGTVDLNSQTLAFTPGAGIDITHSGQAVTFAAESASDTNPGVVELATTAETNTGTATDLAVTPAGLTAWTGDTALVTLGTIATGTWQGTKIAGGYIADDAIDSVHYAADSIDNEHLADDAVGADQLASNAVVNASISSSAAIDMDKLDGGSLAGTLSDLAQGDLMYAGDVDDSNNLKSITFSELEDAIFGNVSGDATIAAGGSLTVSATAIENAMLAGSIDVDNLDWNTVTATPLTDFAQDDHIIVYDKTADGCSSITMSYLEDSIFGNVSGDVTFAAGGASTIGANTVANSMLEDITRGSVKVGGASDAPTDLDAKGDGKILVGDGTDIASVAVSGDVTLANDGTTTIGANTVANSMLEDITRGSVKVGGAADAPTDLDAKGDGKILVGDGTDVASVSVSGDVTLANDGTTTIGADTVSNSMLENIAQGSVKVGGTSNAPTDLDASGDGKLLVGDGTDVNSVAVSGDIALTNAGLTTIQALAVDNGMLAGSIANAKLSNSTISGVALGGTLGALTSTSGGGVSMTSYTGTSAVADVALDVASMTDLGGASVAQADEFAINDGGTMKKVNFSDLEDSIYANISGDATVAAGGILTVSATAIENAMLAGSIDVDNLDWNTVTATPLTDFAQDDHMIMYDKTADACASITLGALEDAIFGNVSGDIAIAAGGAVTIQANSVALATDTTGDYVASVTAGTGLTSDGATTGENISHSLSVDAVQAGITTLAGATAIGTSGATTTFSGPVTVAEASLLNGAVTLGNATSDDLTFTGRAASGLAPKADDTHDLGTSSLHWNVTYSNEVRSDADEMIISADGDETSVSGSAADSLSLNASGGIFTDDAVDMDSTLNVEGNVTVQADVLPAVDGTSDLGSSTYRYALTHTDEVEMANCHRKDFSKSPSGSAMTIFTFADASFKSAKVNCSISSGNNATASEVLVVSNNSTCKLVEYGKISVGTEIGMTWAATSDGTTTTVTCNATGTLKGSVELIK